MDFLVQNIMSKAEGGDPIAMYYKTKWMQRKLSVTLLLQKNCSLLLFIPHFYADRPIVVVS